ncbi:alpha-amylase/4-alpha-glucanotransferase domain-containing protein, partial [Candidatus Omnitrophota bacterium]
LTDNQDWIKIVTFSEYLDLCPPLNDVDIPEASYDEMLEWSGGSWMNFLSKYPESNQMHKRMLYVSSKISEAEQQPEHRERIEDAQRELYMGQTNCPYWHGVFGGVYLYHLRKAVYEHLINADTIVDGVKYRDENNVGATIKELDFYNRGAKAIILEDKNFFICVDPLRGGAIRELDYKLKAINLVNTLARRKEHYHKKILERIKDEFTQPLDVHESIKTVDKRIKKGIFYDKVMRSCLVDHFIDKDLKVEDFSSCNYVDRGDFVDAPYIARIEKEKVVLSCEGKVKGRAMLIIKEVRIYSDTEIEISYILKNKSNSSVVTFFGTEFNITLPYASSDRYHSEANGKKLGGLNKSGIALKTNSFSIKDSKNELGVEFIFSGDPEKIWYFPVMTVSQSERAYDFTYQSSCVFPIWKVKLDSKEEKNLCIKWIVDA